MNWQTVAKRVGAGIGVLAAVLLVLAVYAYYRWSHPVGSGGVVDEAKAAGRDSGSFHHADFDYFSAMENGVVKQDPAAARGRNMWIVWTGGNDRFWDKMTTASFGVFDLLKTISSHPSQKQGGGQPYNRDSRWKWLGVVNEPCFDAPKGPDPERFNLWLDTRRKDCPLDPFANEKDFPGVAVGARGKSIGKGKTLPVGSFYGEPTGIVGLRMFPNPDFDEEAANHWDAEKYYTDPDYYNDPKLVRPYRVGMSCGFCHVGPSPTHPPANPAHPEWADLNSTVGAQYLWLDRIFSYAPDYTSGDSNFLDQLLRTYSPGTMDTSLVSTDYIDNPRTMNAVYNLKPRLQQSLDWGKNTLVGGERNNKQLENIPGVSKPFFIPPDVTWSPHVLKDGSDSVGALGALNRVYLNIGLFSEEWLTHFYPFFGGKPISPIEIAVAEKNSVYWQATEAGTPDMATFLLAAGKPDHLEDAPGGKEMLADQATIDRGRTVFADTCARCHSSRLPSFAKTLLHDGCAGPGYLECWKAYWAATKTDRFKAEMRGLVADADFIDPQKEYLSSDAWVPVTLLRTNICSPLATNAIADNIWNDFSSSSYKSLPSVGTVTVQDPFTGEHHAYGMPAGGRGYTRVPSLVSVWSTAPFFLNNRLGDFTVDPSVKERVRLFDIAIRQLLFPDKRGRTVFQGRELDGIVDLTTERSWLKIPAAYLSSSQLSLLEGGLNGWLPYRADASGHALLDATKHIDIGPIPKGTPVNLLANMRPLAEEPTDDQWSHLWKMLGLLRALKHDLKGTAAEAAIDDAQFNNLAPQLADLSKCPDYVVNRGHYFGTAEFNNTSGLTEDEKSFGPEPVLSDDDKNALIEFLKTL
jgi:hypothetical protein